MLKCHCKSELVSAADEVFYEADYEWASMSQREIVEKQMKINNKK